MKKTISVVLLTLALAGCKEIHRQNPPPGTAYTSTSVTNGTNAIDNTVPLLFEVTTADQTSSFSTVPIKIKVISGTISFTSIVVDPAGDFRANPKWIPNTNQGSQTITANIGDTPGWHTVWIGMASTPAGNNSAWLSALINRTASPIEIIITSPPPNGETTNEMIQVNGHITQPLAFLTYTVNETGSDRATFVSHTPEGIYNFECDAVRLNKGSNTIHFHGIDNWGNTIDTNVTYISTSNGKVSTPVVNWPSNGMVISGDTFMIDGQIDNPAGGVVAIVTGGNGHTSVANAIVELDGKFWVNSLPLVNGTNKVTLRPVNSGGEISGPPAEFSVIKSQPTRILTANVSNSGKVGALDRNATVIGTVDASCTKITVNGIATKPTGTTWSVTVPIPLDEDTITFQVTATFPDSTLDYKFQKTRQMR